MAIKNQDLVKVWDEKKLIENNIQFLKQPTKKVDFPISEHIESIIQDLIDTYKATPCAGIAANQIGYNKSKFISRLYQHELDHLNGKLMIEDREKIKDGFINEQISKELFHQLLNRLSK